MFLLLVQIIKSVILEQCDVLADKDLTLTLYTRNKCGPCDRIKPFVEEIDSRLERNNKALKIRMVNCSTCDCVSENIKVVPELIINNDGVESARLTGFQEFGQIIEFLVANTGLERQLLSKRIKSSPGNVVKLNEKDFYTGFDGPWLVLFYDTKSDAKRELITEIASEYVAKLNVGEIDGNTSAMLLQRFSIPKLPSLIALYNGLLVGYNGEDQIDDLRDFIDELIRPSFENIDLKQFTSMRDKNQIKSPIFIVFYKDLGTANEYFKSVAHEYKFKTRIYKSEDKQLINEAHIDMQNKDMSIVAYRHGTFHECPYDATEMDKIFEWIWHSHYPNVTKMNNDNYFGIMHGLKPIVLLLTKDELFMNEFEQTSERIHKGMPFTDQLFASIDVEIYSSFIPHLLPGIKVPYIVIFDPKTEKFHTQKMKLTKESLQEIVMTMIESYNEKKLFVYPYQHSWLHIFIIVAIVLVLAFAFIKKLAKKKLKVTQKL
ncbi:hypothetical protein BDAP_000377 [Binucleata daphniae]